MKTLGALCDANATRPSAPQCGGGFAFILTRRSGAKTVRGSYFPPRYNCGTVHSGTPEFASCFSLNLRNPSMNILVIPTKFTTIPLNLIKTAQSALRKCGNDSVENLKWLLKTQFDGVSRSSRHIMLRLSDGVRRSADPGVDMIHFFKQPLTRSSSRSCRNPPFHVEYGHDSAQ